MTEIKKKNNSKIVNFVNRIYHLLKATIADVTKHNENTPRPNSMLYQSGQFNARDSLKRHCRTVYVTVHQQKCCTDFFALTLTRLKEIM